MSTSPYDTYRAQDLAQKRATTIFRLRCAAAIAVIATMLMLWLWAVPTVESAVREAQNAALTYSELAYDLERS